MSNVEKLEAKIGHEVVIFDSFGFPRRIDKISDETKTSWRVNGVLYNKTNLNARGSGPWGDCLVLADANLLAETRLRFKKHKLLKDLNTTPFSQLTLEQLEIVVFITKEGVAK